VTRSLPARLLGLLALLLVLLPAVPAAAQTPITEWSDQFGTVDRDEAHGVAVDAAGNVYVAGNTAGILQDRTGGRPDDGFLRKYAADGAVVWTRQFGTDDYDFVSSVAVDGAGNIYLAGSTAAAFPGFTYAGNGDAFVRQYHADGSEGWTRQFGTSEIDGAWGVAADAAGDVYVVGETWGAFPGQTNAGEYDAFVRQYRSDGSEGWTSEFGGAGWDRATGAAVDSRGDVYVVRSAVGTFTATPDYDVVVRKYAPGGGILWSRHFGTGGPTTANGIAADSLGNVYVAGTGFGGYVRQYHADGTDGWARQFGTGGSAAVWGVAVDGRANVYLVGTASDASLGWWSGFGLDVFVREYRGDGSEGWTTWIASVGDTDARGIAVDASANVYVGGWTTGDLSYHLGVGGTDAFVVKLRPTDTPVTNPATPIAPFPRTDDRVYFPPTDHALAYGFKAYWERNGGLPVFGYPLTEEFTENGFTVQYTERQRFEWHPTDRGTPYEFQLGLLGFSDAERRGLYAAPAFQPLPQDTQSDANCRFFAETGHRVCFGFKSYWQLHGLDLGDPGVSFRESLALFGYPISEEFVDPQTGLVTQYFERAVFEYHPNNPEPYTVLLRRLGADDLQSRGWIP